MGLCGGKHGFRIRSEIYSLGHLSESAATSSSIELWHGVLVGLWQVGTCLKVGGTHLECEFFSIVRSARSLALALRPWIEEVLRFLHLDGLHIVLVATGFEQDISFCKFVSESVPVVLQISLSAWLFEGRLCLRGVLARLTECDRSNWFLCWL